MQYHYTVKLKVNHIEILSNFSPLVCIRLGCGLWNREEVISWCDRLIEANDHPPYEIMEISLMSKAKLIYIESALLSYSRIVDENPR